jgi:hypothetical protein
MKLSLREKLLSYTYLTSLLVQQASCLGFVNTPTTRDLHLAAALGLSADAAILDPVNFRKMVDTSFSQTMPTEYADVC